MGGRGKGRQLGAGEGGGGVRGVTKEKGKHHVEHRLRERSDARGGRFD